MVHKGRLGPNRRRTVERLTSSRHGVTPWEREGDRRTGSVEPDGERWLKRLYLSNASKGRNLATHPRNCSFVHPYDSRGTTGHCAEGVTNLSGDWEESRLIALARRMDSTSHTTGCRPLRARALAASHLIAAKSSSRIAGCRSLSVAGDRCQQRSDADRLANCDREGGQPA